MVDYSKIKEAPLNPFLHADDSCNKGITNNWEGRKYATWAYADQGSYRNADQDVGSILTGASDVIDKTGGLFTAKKDRAAASKISGDSLAAQKERTKQLELMIQQNKSGSVATGGGKSKTIWWIAGGVAALSAIGLTIYFIRK